MYLYVFLQMDQTTGNAHRQLDHQFDYYFRWEWVWEQEPQQVVPREEHRMVRTRVGQETHDVCEQTEKTDSSKTTSREI
jgi:hypothetical protein